MNTLATYAIFDEYIDLCVAVHTKPTIIGWCIYLGAKTGATA